MAERVKYDAVIIGAGHNGLVAACYMAQKGLNVCIVERYHEVGGAAISEETFPGFKISTGSYVLSLAPRKIFDDLGAWDGIELLERNPRFFAPYPDGTSLTYWNDHDRWIKEIEKISPKDAKAFDHYDADIERACQTMDKYIMGNPPSFDQVAADFKTADEKRIFKLFYLGSAADISEYYFDSTQMRAIIAASGLIGTPLGPRDVGTGFNKLYHTMGTVTGLRGSWAYVRGAMGSVTQALKRVALRSGVTIRTSAEVAQIRIEGGRATGVILESGEVIESKVVLSNADPKRTYLKLVEGGELPDAYKRQIEGIKITAATMKINLATSELPNFTALPADRQMDGSSGGLYIAPSIEYLQRAADEAKLGLPSTEPFMNVHMQSAVDKTVAPEGMHTISIFTQYFPYHLKEGTWDERRDEIADHVIAEFAKYAPNIPAAIVGRQVLAPPDLEARFGLTGGHIFQGDQVPEQMFDMRPVAGSTSYEGPVGGLFLCGAGAWPGGCVMGIPGHNAAMEVIRRFEI